MKKNLHLPPKNLAPIEKTRTFAPTNHNESTKRG